MSSISLWGKNNPFSDLDTMLENFYKGDLPVAWNENMKKTLAAQCEITETPQNYTLKFDVPGMKKEDIKVDLHNNRLTVSGERKEEKKEDNKKVHYSEVKYGSFMRSYTFPRSVDSEKVEANYNDGVLTINVAKTASSNGRQISVK